MPDQNTNDAGEDTGVSLGATLEQRGTRYGKFVNHAEVSQAIQQRLLSHAYNQSVGLSAIHKEAISMICHKLGRIVNGDPNYDDSWRDIAGYATLVEKHINGESV